MEFVEVYHFFDKKTDIRYEEHRPGIGCTFNHSLARPDCPKREHIPGAKARVVAAWNVRAKARTYLRGNNDGNGKAATEILSFAQNDEQKQVPFGNDKQKRIPSLRCGMTNSCGMTNESGFLRCAAE